MNSKSSTEGNEWKIGKANIHKLHFFINLNFHRCGTKNECTLIRQYISEHTNEVFNKNHKTKNNHYWTLFSYQKDIMYETFSFQLKEFLNDSINSSKLKQTKKGFEPLHTFLINSSKIPSIQVFKQTEFFFDRRAHSINFANNSTHAKK